MEQFTLKYLVWMRTNIQEFKDPPEGYKDALAKLDDIIIKTINDIRTHRMDPA